MSISQPDPRQLELDFDDRLPPMESSASGVKRRHIVLGQQILEYALRRSRRRSIGLLVEESGLRVTAPHWVTLPQIEQAILQKQRWIVAKLSEARSRRMPPRIDWSDGARLPFRGESIVLSLGHVCDAPTLDASVLRLPLPTDSDAARVRDAVCAWLQREALDLFRARAQALGARIGVAAERIVLTSARTLWGSCTAQGVIRLNWRLVHFSQDIIDYVVAHELAHLKELNHSRLFWDTVASMLPGFEISRRELRSYHPGRVAHD